MQFQAHGQEVKQLPPGCRPPRHLCRLQGPGLPRRPPHLRLPIPLRVRPPDDRSVHR
jgi:hypothetical protein